MRSPPIHVVGIMGAPLVMTMTTTYYYEVLRKTYCNIDSKNVQFFCSPVTHKDAFSVFLVFTFIAFHFYFHESYNIIVNMFDKKKIDQALQVLGHAKQTISCTERV